MIILDMIIEYLLISYLKLLGAINKDIPKEWESGTKGVVIIIPGFHETFNFLAKIANVLNNEGYKILTPRDFDTKKPRELLSKQIAKIVNDLDEENIILLGHSKGAFIAKYTIDNFNTVNKKISKVITIAAPFKGTIFGKLKFHNLHELDPEGDFIKNSQNNSNLDKIINFYPKFDNHVIPLQSSVLENGNNNKININGHTRILWSKELLLKLKETISQ